MPRELRHPFVSLLSGSGVRLEGISRLVGYSGTPVTDQTGAVGIGMDGIVKIDREP